MDTTPFSCSFAVSLGFFFVSGEKHMSYIHKCDEMNIRCGASWADVQDATTVERHCRCQPSETARLAAGLPLANWLGLAWLDWFSDLHVGGLAAACRPAVSPWRRAEQAAGSVSVLRYNAASTVGQISLTVAACGEQMAMCARLGERNWMADQAKIPSTDRAWTTRVSLFS